MRRDSQGTRRIGHLGSTSARGHAPRVGVTHGRRLVCTVVALGAIGLTQSACTKNLPSVHQAWWTRETSDAPEAPNPDGRQTDSTLPAEREAGLNMGVGDRVSDWAYADPPIAPGGLDTHQRIQRITFERGSARLDQEAHGALFQVKDRVRESTRWHVMAVGFADREEAKADSRKLAQSRAEAVKRWLVGQGVAPDRISTMSMGSRYAEGDAFEPMAMRSDRRVEVWTFME